MQNATDQARHVAATILGADRAYDALPWFWSHQGEVKLQIAGLRLPGDESVVLGDPATEGFSVCCYREGRLARTHGRCPAGPTEAAEGFEQAGHLVRGMVGRLRADVARRYPGATESQVSAPATASQN